MKLTKALLILIVSTALVLLGCARQTTPTGGPKDTIPPTLQISFPKKQSTNFRAREILMIFSEEVAINNPKEQIIITPSVDKKYDITVKKNKVTLTFEKKLQDSTTYTINFRNSIQDITEKNSAKNLKLAFSTGDYIDSISISGKIIDPLKFSEIKQATVAMYQSDTFNIFKHKPVIITETDEKGNYLIENIKPGKYHIYAIEDKNKNLIADSKSERYGFLTEEIDLSKNITAKNIPLQKLDTRPLKVISARSYNSYFNIKTSKSLLQYKMVSLENSPLRSIFGDGQESVKVYKNQDQQIDSIKFRLTASDSANNTIDTILYAKFNPKKPKLEPFTIKTSHSKTIQSKGTFTIQIQYNKPLSKITFDSIYYKIDSASTIHFTSQDITIDTLNNIIHIKKQIDKSILQRPEGDSNPVNKTPIKTDQKTRPKLFLFKLAKSALISIEQDSSISTSEPVKPLYYDETGIITVTVDTKSTNYVIELLDQSYKVLRSTVNKKTSVFDDLPPGDYLIRTIVDNNKDGKWTYGSFADKIEPEQTTLYKNEKGNSTIKLKANFELGPLLIKF